MLLVPQRGYACLRPSLFPLIGGEREAEHIVALVLDAIGELDDRGLLVIAGSLCDVVYRGEGSKKRVCHGLKTATRYGMGWGAKCIDADLELPKKTNDDWDQVEILLLIWFVTSHL